MIAPTADPAKKILVLVHTPQTRPGHLNWTALRDLIRAELPDITVEMSALNQLTFLLQGPKTQVYDAGQGFDVADFDLVVFRTISKERESAIAVAAYCRKKGVAYIDQHIPTTGGSKLSCAFVRWEHDLPVPPTAYGPADNLLQIARSGILQWPLVVKDDNGKKGRDNYLVHSTQEVQNILTVHTDKRFVIQSFIPNEGDYRVLVLYGQPRVVILRRGAADTHLNNTSRGGTAELIPLAKVPQNMIELAVRAAALERLMVAGVDIISDKKSGKRYVLEVNKAPQLATGASADLKMKQYALALREMAEARPKVSG